MAKVEKTIKTNEDGTFDVEIMIGGGPGLVDVSVQAAVQGGGSASVATAKGYVPAPGGGSGGSSPTTTTPSPTTTITTTPEPGVPIRITSESILSGEWEVVYYRDGREATVHMAGVIYATSGTTVLMRNLSGDLLAVETDIRLRIVATHTDYLLGMADDIGNIYIAMA